MSQYTCEKCGKRFNSPASLGGHITEAHAEREPCRYCGRKFSPGGLVMHQRYCDSNPSNQHICANPNCDNMTTNDKYCSVSCSNMTRRRPSKITSRYRNASCTVCGKPISRNNHSSLCREHWLDAQIEGYGTKTIQEAMEEGWEGKHKYQKIRNHAHRVAERFMREQRCKECGYDTYVELCHLTPISDFPLNTPLSTVNSTENLAWLCPNHHKEFDLGLLEHAGIA